MKKLNIKKPVQILMVSVSVAFLAYASATLVNKIKQSKITESVELLAAKATKYDEGNYNKILQAKGFDKVAIDDKKGHVFVIEFTGEFDGLSAIKFIDKVELVAAKAKDGDKLILDIDSNGGDAFACTSMASNVDLIKDEVDIEVISIIDYWANSCGYLLAASAEKIIMSKSAEVGNIGSLTWYTKEIASNNENIKVKGGSNTEVVKIGSTRIKELLSGSPVKTKEDEDVHKFLLSKSAEQFFNYISISRGDRLGDKNTVFSGLSFYYEDALELGLVDGYGNTRSVLRKLYREGHKITKIN